MDCVILAYTLLLIQLMNMNFDSSIFLHLNFLCSLQAFEGAYGVFLMTNVDFTSSDSATLEIQQGKNAIAAAKEVLLLSSASPTQPLSGSRWVH